MAATGRGLVLGLTLPASGQHEVGDLLCVGRGAADLPGIFFERRDPALDVGGPRLGSWPTPTRSPVIMALTTAKDL